MDVLRRPYTALCRFVDGQPPSVIRWYHALPGATIYPNPTAFGSSSYDNSEMPPKQGPGELTGGLIHFCSGVLPPRVGTFVPVGTPDQFRYGLLTRCHPEQIKGPPYPSRTQALDSLNGV